jgi:hypothetical protein
VGGLYSAVIISRSPFRSLLTLCTNGKETMTAEAREIVLGRVTVTVNARKNLRIQRSVYGDETSLYSRD